MNSTIPSDKFSDADFFQAVVRAATGDIDPLLTTPTAAAPGMREAIPSEGGFLVSPTFGDRVLAKVYDTGELLRRCTELETDGKNNVFYPTVVESDRGDGSRFGGMTSYRISEGGTITDSTSKLGGQLRSLHKIAGLCYVTDELLEDAPGLLPTFLEFAAAQEMGFRAEDDIVNGDGVAKALGLLHAPCRISVTAETNQTAATVWGVNIRKMISRLWGASFRQAVWLFNPSLLTQLGELADSGSWGSAATSISDSPIPLFEWGQPGQFARLCGRPAIPCEYCAAAGTEGDLILTDLTQYAYALKQRTSFSAHVQFLTEQSCFKFVWSFDGAPIWGSAVTPANGTDTLSPIITLATRS